LENWTVTKIVVRDKGKRKTSSFAYESAYKTVLDVDLSLVVLASMSPVDLLTLNRTKVQQRRSEDIINA